MQAIELWSDEPEILGGTQTFIGVMVTLIVLCIFCEIDGSNFLRKIACIAWQQLREANAAYIADLKAMLDITKNIPESFRPLVTQSKTWERIATGDDKVRFTENRNKTMIVPLSFFENAQEAINSSEEKIKKYQNRKEDTFIQLFLLIVSIFVLTIDSMHIGCRIGALILNIASFCIVLFSGSMWLIKLKNLMPVHNVTKRTNLYKRYIGTTFFVILLFVFFLSLLGLSIGCFFVFFLNICMFSSFAIYVSIKWSKIQMERYNIRFVIEHSLYVILLLMVCSTVFYCICYIVNYPVLYNDIRLQSYFIRWQTNIELITNIKYAQTIFACTLSMCGLFVPIVIDYSVSSHYAKSAKKQIVNYFNDAKKNAEKLQNEYVKIITSIFNNQNSASND